MPVPSDKLFVSLVLQQRDSHHPACRRTAVRGRSTRHGAPRPPHASGLARL